MQLCAIMAAGVETVIQESRSEKNPTHLPLSTCFLVTVKQTGVWWLKASYRKTRRQDSEY